MREIKFRAWDNEDKDMLLTPDIYLCQETAEARERYTLMQYTGLKDKNSKEIYEGDIVRLFNYSQLQVVEWTPYPEVWSCFNYYSEPSYYEVIGNIYEHPDLLTL